MVRWAAGPLAGLGVRNLTGVLAVMLIAVLALRWVLRDEDRTWRLAQIIGAWRGTHRVRLASRTGRPLGVGAGR